ncbi:MAG: DNRLRE domain-containing protein [Chitinophagaceae bacterium]
MLKINILLLFFFVPFSICQKEVDNFTYNPPIADAGQSQNVQLPNNFATLTGSGTSQNGAIVAYLWSLVSGPNIPAIESPGSPTTQISNLIEGAYVFQLMVIDEIGLTGVDKDTVTVIPSLIQTLTLQPGNSTENELNFAVTGPNDVSAHDIDLDAGAWTSSGLTFNIRGAFKFDLSAIPAGATIISAKLSLYSNPTPINGDLTNANSGSNNAMYISRITSDWNGLTSSWQTQPTLSSTDRISIAHTNLSVLDLVDVDVTGMVATMHSTNNYGFMISLQNEVAYNIRQFYSSNHSEITKRPKLVVVYQ